MKLTGWAGFFAIVPWFQALVWAFKPTDVVDVRRFRREEQAAEREELAGFSGRAPAEKKPSVPRAPRPVLESVSDSAARQPNGRK